MSKSLSKPIINGQRQHKRVLNIKVKVASNIELNMVETGKLSFPEPANTLDFAADVISDVVKGPWWHTLKPSSRRKLKKLAKS